MRYYVKVMTTLLAARPHVIFRRRPFGCQAFNLHPCCSTPSTFYLDERMSYSRHKPCFRIVRFTTLRPEDHSTVADGTKLSDHPEKCKDHVDTAELLGSSYNSGETDEVQDAIVKDSIFSSLFRGNQFTTTEEIGQHLIQSAIKAATADNRLNRGALMAILNSILACCCVRNLAEIDIALKFPELAWEILQQMDEMHARDEDTMVTPDLVTLSLVYYSFDVACHAENATSDFYTKVQANILERAQRMAKKSSGSSRRKALAAERRKKQSNATSDNLTAELQSLYGPDISILHQDEDMLIVSKPAGMVCYHNKKTSAGKLTTSRKKKNRKGEDDEPYGTKMLDISLEDALLDKSVPLSTLNPTARGTVHRLDRGTSGTIILAKNDAAHLKLVAMFFLRKVKKKYLALVPANDKDLAPDGVINSIVDGRPAFSRYKIVRMYVDPLQKQGQSKDHTATLLEVETVTGRKHQVRVHCANGLGCPIFLDPLYSNHLKVKSIKTRDRKSNSKSDSHDDEAIPAAILEAVRSKEHFFLHASAISLPDLGINVESPLPNCWSDVLSKWEEL